MNILQSTSLAIATVATITTAATGKCLAQDTNRPNIILMMADDMGYGDTGFNGNKIIKTPNLDAMAKAGAILTNFHAGGPVSSPTRATCLTGRHYHRTGIFTANFGHLPENEVTIPELLKERGYTTGHFGKWHLGTLSKTMSCKGERRDPELNYSPPSVHGYDRSFATEASVATWDPGYCEVAAVTPFYDDGVALEPNGNNNLKGGAARVVMDRAIPFIEKAVKSDTPFLAVIWFHAPHAEVKAGPEYLKMYSEYPEGKGHYYGCITELDEQVGRLRKELKELGVADNTMLWFASDNGPEGRSEGAGSGTYWGVTDGLRGRKRALFEGGVRVPALVEWSGHVKAGTTNDTPMSTLDYLPTIQTLVGYEMPDDRPIDGVNVLDIIQGKSDKRNKPIPLRFKPNPVYATQAAIIDGDLKFFSCFTEDGKEDMLFDLSKDRSEKNNILAQYPEKGAEMKQSLHEFIESAKKSHSGADYDDPTFVPVHEWEDFSVPKSKEEWDMESERKRKKKEMKAAEMK